MAGKKLIFVVDDDPFILNLVSKRLVIEGYQVKSFSYGEECVSSLSLKPDLIVLDYLFYNKERSEVMDGKVIFSLIQQFDKSIPVIILSGQEDGAIVLELARLGIEDYVIKDEDLIDNLLEIVKGVLDVAE